MKRAALYIRVSSDEQVHETYGLPEQLATCHEYAQRRGYTLVGDRWADLKSGLEIVKDGDGWRFADPRKAEKARAQAEHIEPVRCYVDDYTGKRANRPGMDALRDYIERVGLDAVIPRDTQRFARKRHVAGFLKNWFKRFGVDIEYATQDFADTAAGSAQEGMHEVFDEWQAEELREKATRGRRRSAMMGNVVLSQAPYGYCIVGQRKNARLAIDEGDAEIVRLIFDLYVNGDGSGQRLSLMAIAKKLTARRVPTAWDKLGKKKKSGFGVWSPSSVRTILGNSACVGRWHYGKRRRITERVTEGPDGRRAILEVESSESVPQEQWIEVQVPAILEGDKGQALFDAAQARLRENKRFAKRNNRKNQYLLRGMLVCECGATMAGTPAPQGGYTYYRCMRRQWEKSNAGRNRCPSKMLRADKADAAIWAEIGNRLLDPDNLIKGMKERQAAAERELSPLTDQLHWVEGELVQAEARIERAMELYLDGDYPKEWLDDRIAKERRGKAGHERARRDLLGRIEAGRISDDDIETVETFARRVADSIKDATFEDRRRIVEMLRLRGRVQVKDGEQIIAGSWIIPGDELIVNVTNPAWSISGPLSTLASSKMG